MLAGYPAALGTEHVQAGGGQPVDLAAAVSRTQDQTARIAVTISTQTEGMTISYAETGVYDFADSRGMISMLSPLNITELFLPSTTYIKLPAGLTGADGGGSGGKSLPNGKTWIALPDGASGDVADSLLGSPQDGADPADLLAALKAASSSVTRLGASVIRGVPVRDRGRRLGRRPESGAAGGAEAGPARRVGRRPAPRSR